MQVFLSELADLKLQELTMYLLEEWGLKVKKDFLNKLEHKVNIKATRELSSINGV